MAARPRRPGDRAERRVRLPRRKDRSGRGPCAPRPVLRPAAPAGSGRPSASLGAGEGRRALRRVSLAHQRALCVRHAPPLEGRPGWACFHAPRGARVLHLPDQTPSFQTKGDFSWSSAWQRLLAFAFSVTSRSSGVCTPGGLAQPQALPAGCPFMPGVGFELCMARGNRTGFHCFVRVHVFISL